MRCPDCNRMVSYDEENEPEENDAEVNGLEVTVSVRRTLGCAECSTELRGIDLDLTGTATITNNGDGACVVDGETTHAWEVSEVTLEAMTKTEKRRSHYGVTGVATLECSVCGAEAVAEGMESRYVTSTEMEESV